MTKPIFTKLLKPQERGIKGGNTDQRGTYVLVAKRYAAGGNLPALGTAKNPKVLLKVTSRRTGKKYEWSYTYHNGKNFGGTRDEYRIYTRGVSDFDDKKSLLPGNLFRMYKGGTAVQFEFDTVPAHHFSPVTQLVVLGDITHAEFDPHGLIDERTFRKVLRAIRAGQAKFRKDLLSAYGSRCAITGADVDQCLEAAHIADYSGPKSNVVSNGILLRADMHSLFDAGLLSIDPKSNAVTVSSKILGTGTANSLNGKVFTPPTNRAHRPNADAIRAHRKKHGL
jgi:hypothetical protein